MQQYTRTVPVAVITAHGNMETAVRALKVRAFDFVSKSFELADLRNLLVWRPPSYRVPTIATPGSRNWESNEKM